MARINKKFVLSTSQLNSHKFRCLTSGAELDDFKANPIMYWLHITPEGKGANDMLPIGFWEDIAIEGDEITAYPNFDDSDEFAMKIAKKVEHGTLRAASIEADPIELDTNKANWLPGQRLPTFSRYRIGEASICDRGSNKGAIAKLKHKGQVYCLSDQQSADNFFESLEQKDNNQMKRKLTARVSSAARLTENSEIDTEELLDKLVEVIEDQNATISNKDQKVEELETEVKTLNESASEKKITDMVDKYAKRFLPAERDNYITLAKANYDATEKVLKTLPEHSSIAKRLANDTSESDAALLKLSWDEAHQADKLEQIKLNHPDRYTELYKEQFGKEPKK